MDADSFNLLGMVFKITRDLVIGGEMSERKLQISQLELCWTDTVLN